MKHFKNGFTSVAPSAESDLLSSARSAISPASARSLQGTWETAINWVTRHADAGERYPPLLNSDYWAATHPNTQI